MDMRFEGKICVVTAGAQRIGKSIVEGFLKEGANVAFIDIDEEAGRRLYETAPESLMFYHGDVGEQETLEKFAAAVIERWGRVDCLVNNAGVGASGLVTGCSYEDFMRIQRINLAAPYYLTLRFRDYLPAGSAVVNIASIRAYQTTPDTEAYAASKGGVISLTRGMALSLRGKARVNCVTPAWVRGSDEGTPENPLYGTTTMPDHLQYPVGHVGYPREIAGTVLFLCSEDAGFIDGQNIICDGGMTLQFIQHEDYGWTFDPSKMVRGPHG